MSLILLKWQKCCDRLWLITDELSQPIHERKFSLEFDKELAHFLDPLQLGAWQYHPVVGSSNDIAIDWAKADAPDWGLVIADQQVKGRGRKNRKWVTRPGVSLAFSLVLQPTTKEVTVIPRFTALAALGLVCTLLKMDLRAGIKWPNDVLLNGKKAAGVLVESEWEGDQLVALVVGMGVNIKPEAVPPAEHLRFPATSVEQALDAPVNRWELLADILQEMMGLRPLLTVPEFISFWNAHLAFRGEVVPILFPDDVLKEMEIIGVMADGRLALRDDRGERVILAAGEITLQGDISLFNN